MDHVTTEQVAYRFPCYIKCAGCDAEIEGTSAEEVAERTKYAEWRLFRGWPYCYDCQQTRLPSLESYRKEDADVAANE